jgi:hypothetical protein
MMTQQKKWSLENPDKYHEIQRQYAKRYYYENREKVLAKKQQKYAEARGEIIVKVEDVPVPVPTPPDVPVPEVPKWIHPLFK